MFFRYALQQMPTLFVFAKKAEEKEPHIEKRGAQLISQTKIYSGKEVEKRTLPRRRLSRAVEAQTMRWGNRPPHPHSTGDTPHHSRVREHQKPRYAPTVSSASSASKNAALIAFVPSVPCVPARWNAEDVWLRFYRQFRLCFTTTDFGGRKGIGLSPYPYAVGVTSFDCERNITTVFSPSIYSYQKGLKII